jgi:AcrR family transcriptional regulator
MPGAVPQRQTSPGNTTRERILATARRLFAESGFAGTSVRMIARELGLSDPAVHYHFPTKQALYDALLTEPDYGTLPLDLAPVSRAGMVDQVMHMFGWWTARPEFGQMLLREQLSNDPSSIEFMSSSDEAWERGITAPLRTLAGDEAEDVSALLFNMLAGVFWDSILSYGANFAETVAQPFFVTRLRAMIAQVIPESAGAAHG